MNDVEMQCKKHGCLLRVVPVFGTLQCICPACAGETPIVPPLSMTNAGLERMIKGYEDAKMMRKEYHDTCIIKEVTGDA